MRFKYDYSKQRYIWNDKPVTKKQRSMASYYSHCAALGSLKGDELYNIRMRAVMNHFSTKDSSHANIYRHYSELQNW